MNIRDLEYAVAVADCGHFGRAAAACNISQPALSGQILKLEKELGIALFERTRRRVQVTAVGEEILRHARSLLQTAALIEETANAHKDPLSGRLRLAMIPTIGPYLTPLLLPSLAHHLPGLELVLSEAVTHDLERQLLAGEIDAAVLATPVADRRVETIALYDEPFWVALPHGHSLEQQELVDVSDLPPQDLLVLADGHCLRDQVLSFCNTTGGDGAMANTQNTSLSTILALVGAGAGVTLVPAMSLRGSWVTDAGIAVRREKSNRAQRTVRLACRGSFPRRELIEKIADIICAILPDTVNPERR